MTFKERAKQLLPPRVRARLRALLGKERVEYRGDYPTWEAARQAAGSYDDPAVFERVKEARMKVLRGDAAYERDGVTFPVAQLFPPVIKSLTYAARKSGGALNVMDYGGSLGTSYFQNRGALASIKSLRWNIVEQPHFVAFGKEHLETDELHFYESFGSCMKEARPKVFFISSALQYLPDAYELMQQVRDANFDFIIFDRTTVLERGDDRIVVQNVPRKYYATNFPARLFSEKKLLAFFGETHRLVSDFPSIGDPITLDIGTGRNKGYFFERKI